MPSIPPSGSELPYGSLVLHGNTLCCWGKARAFTKTCHEDPLVPQPLHRAGGPFQDAGCCQHWARGRDPVRSGSGTGQGSATGEALKAPMFTSPPGDWEGARLEALQGGRAKPWTSLLTLTACDAKHGGKKATGPVDTGTHAPAAPEPSNQCCLHGAGLRRTPLGNGASI